MAKKIKIVIKDDENNTVELNSSTGFLLDVYIEKGTMIVSSTSIKKTDNKEPIGFIK